MIKLIFYSNDNLLTLIAILNILIGLNLNVECRLSPIELHNTCKKQEHEKEDKLEYIFFPVPTMIGFGFIGAWLAFIIIAKIMCSSSDQYKMNNRYDLVIYKSGSFKTFLLFYM